MAIGDLIRDLREAANLTRPQMVAALCEHEGKREEDRPTVLGQVKRWESNRGIPGARWLAALSQVLDCPLSILQAEATLSRVNRRAFISLTALVATHGAVAGELLASMAGGDYGPLTTVQTTHATDLVIASLADVPTATRLHGWMRDGGTALLRVNATGILAKRPGQAAAADVARVLTHDQEVRHLYSTAVLARVGGLEWDVAGVVTADLSTAGPRAQFLAARLAAESLNARDAGARWCAAAMLRDLTPLLSWES
ncbi:helix-turn-helix domain-containing protein [Kitasatospora sp. NPDC086801]|uniref:helix-turn-helix domain-containing protein n=1 Tax=Kitasatospora sp. NPDC086801 TaxID=3364066 RepID=UPI003804884C